MSRIDTRRRLADEHDLGRLIDYGVIAPRAQALYEWSATELGVSGSGRAGGSRGTPLRVVA